MRTKDLEFAHFKLMHAHDMSLSNPWRIHLAPGSDVVVTMRSSIKALIVCFQREEGHQDGASGDYPHFQLESVRCQQVNLNQLVRY